MKKTVFLVIGFLALAASITMYMLGKNSSHLSELYDLFWLPLPLAAVGLIGGVVTKKE